MSPRIRTPAPRHSEAHRAGALAVASAALVAGLCGRAWLAYRADLRAARERVSTGSRVVRTPCGAIEYGESGEGEPLLVVHGAGGGFDQGLTFGRPLAGMGFRVVAMSRFGYLRTPLPADASPAAQADAHACLLDALGLPRVAVVGISAGAPSSMQFALRHGERCRALVLLTPAAYVPRPGGTPPLHAPAATRLLFATALQSNLLYWAATRLSRAAVIRGILATPPAVVERADAGERARIGEILAEILPVSARRKGLLQDAAVTSTLPRYDLERIAVPTLTIAADDDLFGTDDAARYSAAHIPGARFAGYPSGGHLWVGHQHEVIAAIADFLRSG